MNGYLEAARAAREAARLAAIEVGLDEEKMVELLGGTLREIGVDVPEGLALNEALVYLEHVPAYDEETKRAVSYFSGIDVDPSAIVIPDGTKRIGDWRFYYLNYPHFTIPASVVEIGENAFSRASSSTSTRTFFFKGRTPDEIRAMSGFPWGARHSIFYGHNGSITIN